MSIAAKVVPVFKPSPDLTAAINGVTVGLAIAAFGGTVSDPIGSLSIQKYARYISINGNISGRIDANGGLIPRSYVPCN